jgi:predicted TIM-barrel fold metal-dependent hydrolase
MPVIDAHTHVFPPDVISMRDRIVARDVRFSLLYANPKARMADGTEVSRYMAEEQIDRAVITAFPFKDRGLITACNDYILEMARRDPKLIPFAMVDVEDERFTLAEAARSFRLGARGIGELAFYETGFGARERKGLDSLADYAQKNGLPLMIHVNEQVGHAYHGKTRMDFPELVAFVETHPELVTILSHLGGGVCFYEFMPEIKKAFARVYYDLAAVPMLYSKEVYGFVAHCLPDKVLFGSDYPLLSYKRYGHDLDLLEEEGRQKLLHLNARHVFG